MLRFMHGVMIAWTLLVPFAAHAVLPCPPPPCKLAVDGSEKCAGKADWVLEGRVDRLEEVRGEMQGPLCGQRGHCPVVWKGSTILIAEDSVSMVKGEIDGSGSWRRIQPKEVRIHTGWACWSNVRPDASWIGMRMRFYGTYLGGVGGQPEYFAFEIVDRCKPLEADHDYPMEPACQ